MICLFRQETHFLTSFSLIKNCSRRKKKNKIGIFVTFFILGVWIAKQYIFMKKWEKTQEIFSIINLFKNVKNDKPEKIKN